MGDDPIKFRERIAYALEYLGRSNDELAKALGVNRNTISAYRLKKGDLKGIVLSNLASKFGFNPDWLLTGEGVMLSDQDQVGYGKEGEPPARVASQEAGYFPDRRGSFSRRRQNDQNIAVDHIPEILVLLARIIEDGRPNLVEMVATYLGNIAALIKQDEK